MFDVAAALQVSIEDEGVSETADSLDKFSASSDRSSKSADVLSGSTRKTIEMVQSLEKHLSAISPALNAADSAGRKANVTVEQAERYMRKASIVLGDMAKAESAAAAGAEELTRKTKGAGQAASEMAKEAQRAAERTKNVGEMSGAAAFASRNLFYQLSDVAQGFALGQKPMQIFMQQGFQIVDAFTMLAKESGGAGTAIASLAAKWAPLAVVVGTGAAAMWGWLETINAEHKGELDAYAASLGLTAEQIEKVGGTAVTAGDLIGGLWDVIKEALNLEQIFSDLEGWMVDTFRTAAQDAKKNISEIYGALMAGVDGIKHVWNNLGPIIGEAVVNAANAAIRATEGMINKAIDGLNKLMSYVNPLLKELGFNGFDPIKHVDLSEIKNVYAGAGRAAAEAFSSSYEKHRASAAAAIQSKIDAVEDAALARRKAKLLGAAEKAGTEVGKAAGAAAGKAAGEEMMPAWVDQMIADLPAQLSELNKALTTQLMAALDAKPLLDDLDEQIMRGAQSTRIAARETEKAAEIQERWNTALDNMLSLLDRLGGAASVFGQISGVLAQANSRDEDPTKRAAQNRANITAALFGLGGVGTIAGSLLGGKEMTEAMGKQFKTALVDVFGVESDKLATKLGNTMANVFQGAGTGAAVGGILGGGQAGQLGSAIGGAAGQAIGSSIAALGSFGGPIGAIGGAIVGNLLGSALSSTKRGGQTISNGSLSGTWGNSDQRIQASTQFATQAIDALGQLADALGTALGDFSSSISVREGNLRFDPTGSGISKTSKGAINFGQDEAGLLKAVIADAIKDGAFSGLSEGFKKYLTSGDVESRLQDVLSLRGIMNEAAQLRDPQGFALAELDKQFDKLREIAKATGEGLADIEYVYGERRKEILKQVGSDATQIEKDRQSLLIQIMQLEGKSTEALAAARALEKSEVDASLKPLYDRIYALQDEATAANQATQALQAVADAARAMNSLNVRLAQAQGDSSTVTQLQRQQELADATDDVIRAKLREIYAAEDAAKAAQNAAAANAFYASSLDDEAQAQTEALKQISDKYRNFTDSLREYTEQLLGTLKDSGATYRDLQVQFMQASALASAGDQTALGNLQSYGEAFLAASKSQSSYLQYQRDIAMVARATGDAADVAERVADIADQRAGPDEDKDLQADLLKELLASAVRSEAKADQAKADATASRQATEKMARLLDSAIQKGAVQVATRQGDKVATE